jgi:hypothetical protein
MTRLSEYMAKGSGFEVIGDYSVEATANGPISIIDVFPMLLLPMEMTLCAFPQTSRKRRRLDPHMLI